jgi:hypothetical protein
LKISEWQFVCLNGQIRYEGGTVCHVQGHKCDTSRKVDQTARPRTW